MVRGFQVRLQCQRVAAAAAVAGRAGRQQGQVAAQVGAPHQQAELRGAGARGGAGGLAACQAGSSHLAGLDPWAASTLLPGHPLHSRYPPPHLTHPPDPP